MTNSLISYITNIIAYSWTPFVVVPMTMDIQLITLFRWEFLRADQIFTESEAMAMGYSLGDDEFFGIPKLHAINLIWICMHEKWKIKIFITFVYKSLVDNIEKVARSDSRKGETILFIVHSLKILKLARDFLFSIINIINYLMDYPFHGFENLMIINIKIIVLL